MNLGGSGRLGSLGNLGCSGFRVVWVWVWGLRFEFQA